LVIPDSKHRRLRLCRRQENLGSVHAIKVRGARETFSAKNVAEDPTSGGEKEPDYSTL
jgi:hypothetical protein